jgi:site-specific DNA-cytosine methylase
MEGLGNSGSSLFFQAVKVIKRIKPDIVLFENVAEITVTSDLDVILSTMKRNGYECRWTTCSGADVQCPQIRRRWFCMCVKVGVHPAHIKLPASSKKNPWKLSSMPKLVSSKPDDYIARSMMLGNSIIPQVARLAFVRLFTGFETYSLSEMHKKLHVEFCRVPSSKYDLRGGAHGFVSRGVRHSFGSPSIAGTFTISLDPSQYAGYKTESSQAALPAIKDTVVRHAFPTPRTHMWRSSNVLTLRTMRDLPTFALFVKNVQGVDQPRSQVGNKINIAFVEWLMGFPVGWTSK